MSRLMLLIFSIASTTMMGIGIIITLVLGLDTLRPIVIAAALGFVLALPVSFLVAKQLS